MIIICLSLENATYWINFFTKKPGRACCSTRGCHRSLRARLLNRLNGLFHWLDADEEVAPALRTKFGVDALDPVRDDYLGLTTHEGVNLLSCCFVLDREVEWHSAEGTTAVGHPTADDLTLPCLALKALLTELDDLADLFAGAVAPVDADREAYAQ